MEKKKRKPRRTRLMIRKDIFDAVNEIVRKEGFLKLSITQIAEYADMEPIVILRGFSTVENIIEQYVERFDFWLSYFSQEDFLDFTPDRETYKTIIYELLDVVFRKKEIQQLIAWELAEDSRLTRDIAQRRDYPTSTFLSLFSDRFDKSGLDLRMLSTILVSAVYYLSVHRNRSTSFGMDLSGKPGKKLFINGINKLIDVVFDHVEKTKEKEIARRLFDKGDSVDEIARITDLPLEDVISAINADPQSE